MLSGLLRQSEPISVRDKAAHPGKNNEAAFAADNFTRGGCFVWQLKMR